eukprot:10576362-Heterocapsa_arctica.AAC.1
MEQARDTKEWGGFEQMLVFSKCIASKWKFTVLAMIHKKVMVMTSSPTKSVSVYFSAIAKSWVIN